VPKASSPSGVLKILENTYGEVKCELGYETPLQLLIATILSAQCTDERVNKVAPGLFRQYPTVENFAASRQGDVEKIIYTLGFYRQKSKSIRACCQAICERHDGQVPRRMDDLIQLAGVGRKTANVVLNEAFGLPAIAVDTHVLRTCARLGWIDTRDPVKAEFEIMERVPKKWWRKFSLLMIHHGRRCCRARGPACATCQVLKKCPWGLERVSGG
jgi:endonuclease-3